MDGLRRGHGGCGAAALELNIFLQPTDRHRTAQELEQDYADVVRRVAAAVKIPVSVKLPMRLTNVLAVADSLLARGARGVVMFNRFFEPDIDVERMAFVNGNPFSEPAELRNVLRSVALCSTALPQLDVAVSTGVHDGEAAVKALLCGANAVQVCSAIHEKGFGVIAGINRFIEQWAERHGFESLGEFRGRMDYGNAESDVYQRVQYMKYFRTTPNRRRRLLERHPAGRRPAGCRFSGCLGRYPVFAAGYLRAGRCPGVCTADPDPVVSPGKLPRKSARRSRAAVPCCGSAHAVPPICGRCPIPVSRASGSRLRHIFVAGVPRNGRTALRG